MRFTVRSLGFTFLGFVAGAIFFITMSTVLAWTGPTQTAPNGNVAAPINVGTTDQIKNAGLGVNSLAVFGNAILNGVGSYLNFGPTAGSSGYGIRNNAGTIEFKNSSGVWASPTAGGRIPGEVAAFNLSACPPGWTALATAAGRFIVGTGSNGVNSYTLGISGGADSRSLTLAQMPSHNHTVTDTYPGNQCNSGWLQGSAWSQPGIPGNEAATTQTTSSVGSGVAIDMRPAYLALLYCQKT